MRTHIWSHFSRFPSYGPTHRAVVIQRTRPRVVASAGVDRPQVRADDHQRLVNARAAAAVDWLVTVPKHADEKVVVIVATIDVAVATVLVPLPEMLHPGTAAIAPAGTDMVRASWSDVVVPVIVPVN